MQPKLSIQNLEKTFKVNEGFGNVREVNVIQGISLDIEEGEFVCL